VGWPRYLCLKCRLSRQLCFLHIVVHGLPHIFSWPTILLLLNVVYISWADRVLCSESCWCWCNFACLMLMVRIRLNCVGVFDVVSFDPNLQSGSTQMERYKVCVYCLHSRFGFCLRCMVFKGVFITYHCHHSAEAGGILWSVVRWAG